MDKNFLELSKNRYSTKVYNKDLKISQEKIEELKQILTLCPSSINCQPWKFIFVSSEEVKSQLAEHSWINKDKINQASHLVVFQAIDDIDLFEKQIRETLPEYAVDYFVQYKKDTAREWFARQLYLSLGYFLSACASMGIDSTPMEGLVPELYDEVLGSKEYKTLFAVAIGYRDAEDFNQPDRLPKQRRPIDEVVVEL